MKSDTEKSPSTAPAQSPPPCNMAATGRREHELDVYRIEMEAQNAELRRAQEELEGQQIELELQNDELRRAQAELELSRNKYSELYDFAPVGYFTFDTGGLILDVNFAGAQLLGIDRAGLVNKPFSAFIKEGAGREDFRRHLATVVPQQGMQRCDLRLTKKDGTVIHGQLQSVLVDDISRPVGHILTSIVDGTAAKQLEMEIQEAREYAENIVETVHKPLVVMDAALKIITANHSFYETFKVTPEETIGEFIYDLGNRQWDIPRLRFLFEGILPHDSVFNGYEVDHHFQSIGRKVIMLNARQIFRNNIGSHIILLTMEDITERKLLEQVLRESEEQLSVTLNSIGDAVIATDGEACVTRMNPIAEQLTGWTKAAAVGKPVHEIFHIVNKDTRQSAPIPVMAAIKHGTIQGLANHTVLIARDGCEYDIADSCAPIRNRDAEVVGAVLVFRDVTEEYVVQQAMRDSAALMRAILNTVVDGIITIHASGGIIETVNPAAEEMFGYSATELEGQNFSLLIPELDQDQRSGSLEYYSASEEAIASGQGREVMGKRKDGSRFPLELAVSEMELGGQRYFTGILRDTTARKQAEDALLKAGALQSAIFNSANFSSIATDAKGVIQIFNVGAERMLGYTAAEVVNQISPADISDPQEVITRAKELSVELDTPITPGFEALVFKASRGIEDIYELTYIRKDGSRFPAVVSVTALRDDQDAIIGYLLIGTDNTARKQAEEALLKAGALQSAIFNSANFSSIATDAKGVIQIFNVGAERMLGYTAAEVMNQITPADISDPREVIVRAEVLSLELGTPITPGFEALVFKASRGIEDIYELTYIRKDGSRFPAVVSVTALRDAQNAIIGYLLIGTDNTARMQVEAERIRLEQVLQDKNTELESAKSVAEKANLAKSDFLSSMSHELRTPLSAILGFAQLMESGIPQPTPAQKRSIDQILKAGWYLLELINEILDLAVIESGKLSMSLEPISLAEIMYECETMIEPQAKKRGIGVIFVHFEAACFVRADRTRVKQVLINLLSNAIKYNRPGGKVVVDSVINGTASVRISVTDTGEGLTPEQLTKLFQPFNRLGQEANAEQGTGIGLVVCKRLVEWMGGVIGVESTVGEGSVFWIELNLTPEPQLEGDTDVLTAVSGMRMEGEKLLYTLLYVEDNPANLMLVEDIIARRPDINLLSASDGKSGIELARASLPDVILMDIHLPGISGIDAMKILIADAATAHIPVIALSANAIPRDIEKGLEAGFFRYLTKPIKVNEFMETVDVALKFSKNIS